MTRSDGERGTLSRLPVSDAAYTDCMTTPVTLRVPDDLLAELDALVPSVHPSRSEALRRALELYLYRVACERDAERYSAVPLTDTDVAVGDDLRDWAATPSW